MILDYFKHIKIAVRHCGAQHLSFICRNKEKNSVKVLYLSNYCWKCVFRCGMRFPGKYLNVTWCIQILDHIQEFEYFPVY